MGCRGLKDCVYINGFVGLEENGYLRRWRWLDLWLWLWRWRGERLRHLQLPRKTVVMMPLSLLMLALTWRTASPSSLEMVEAISFCMRIATLASDDEDNFGNLNGRQRKRNLFQVNCSGFIFYQKGMHRHSQQSQTREKFHIWISP